MDLPIKTIIQDKSITPSLAFIVKLAWANKTKNFESVLKKWHLSLLIDILTFYAASAITNLSQEMFECGSNLPKNSL